MGRNDEAQSGFRRGYSTVDNLFYLMDTVQKYLSKHGGRFYCLFVDFSEPFDSISTKNSLNLLYKNVFVGNILELLVNMHDV